MKVLNILNRLKYYTMKFSVLKYFYIHFLFFHSSNITFYDITNKTVKIFTSES